MDEKPLKGPSKPRGLGPDGAKLWRKVVDQLTKDDLMLDARETRWLEDACREADIVARLEAALIDAPNMVKGSQGQPVINPMLTEVRQHRETIGRLLARLVMADTSTAAGRGYDVSAAARHAARSRWNPRVS